MSTSSIGLSFNILENQSQITKKILDALLPQVEIYFNKNIDKISKIIPDIIIDAIVAQPEYNAITNGILQYELGITNPSQRLSEILNTIKNGSIVQKKPISIKSSGLNGGIKIQMIKKDFSDLLSLGSASITTEEGTQLNWLEWLLLEGDTIIISDHIFVLGPNKYSRTGFGIMRESIGGFWRVPPEYAGNINNNWITRAIDQATPDIENTISKIFSA